MSLKFTESKPDMDLKDKLIIVTGGARGIGLALVIQLIEKQARICVFDIDKDGLTQLKGSHSELDTVECDLTNRSLVEAAVVSVQERLGSIHGLVNNAGILYSEPLVKLSPSGTQKHDPSAWNKVIAANLTSVFHMTSCVAELMIMTRTKGAIINISSVAASGNAGQTAYSAAKAGVNALTAVWAKELGVMGIRVAAVAPGFTDTESTNQVMSDSGLREIVRRVPLRRLGRAEEIAAGIIAILENDFFTGKVFELDGGLIL